MSDALKALLHLAMLGANVTLSEADRLAMRRSLPGRINLEHFREGTVSLAWREYTKVVDGKRMPSNITGYSLESAIAKNILKAQADYVLGALGMAMTKRVALIGFDDAVATKGSRIFKKAADRTPENEAEARKFAGELLDEWVSSAIGFTFDPDKAKRRNPWGDVITHRLEAIISTMFVLLTLVSCEDSEAAVDFQQSPYFQNHFLWRVKAGEQKRLGDDAVAALKAQEGDPMVRHLPLSTVIKLWEELVKG